MGTTDSGDEKKLSELAKRMLAMPPKKREDAKFGKVRKRVNDLKTRPASKGRVHKGTTRA